MKQKLLCLALLLSLLTSCFGASPVLAEDAPAQSEAELHMLNDLVAYIYQSEVLYGDVLWVLDAYADFDARRDWESLQKARASLTIASLDIGGCALPAQEMTPEDQLELMQKGIDVSFMENMASVFAGEKAAIQNTCAHLRAGIMLDVYLKDSWRTCMQEGAMTRELMSCYIQYLANTADWVLASLGDPAVTEKFRGVTEAYCPLTFARQEASLRSPAEYEAAANTLLDRIESLITEESKALGARSNALNRMTELLENRDYAAIGADLLTIENLPLALFYPTWYSENDLFYYWEKDGEIQPTPLPGTALERMPDGCRIRIEGVSREDVQDYQQELEQAGLSCLGATEEEGRLNVYYAVGDSTFGLLWEADTVTILMTKQPVCFVPRWYYPALEAVR